MAISVSALLLQSHFALYKLNTLLNMGNQSEEDALQHLEDIKFMKPQAWNKFFEEEYKPLVQLSSSMSGNKGIGRWLAMTTITKLIALRHRFDTYKSLSSFLKITTKNLCESYLRYPNDEEIEDLIKEYVPEEVTWMIFLHEISKFPNSYDTVLNLLAFDVVNWHHEKVGNRKEWKQALAEIRILNECIKNAL